MRKTGILLAIILTLTAPGLAQSVDELVAKNIAARGGGYEEVQGLMVPFSVELHVPGIPGSGVIFNLHKFEVNRKVSR